MSLSKKRRKRYQSFRRKSIESLAYTVRSEKKTNNIKYTYNIIYKKLSWCWETRDTMVSAQHVQLSPFFPTSLAPSFSDTRGSLNFLSVHSCSQNLPLISCMSAKCIEVSMRTKGVKLNFYHWCKTPSSAFSKKNSATTPFFARFR